MNSTVRTTSAILMISSAVLFTLMLSAPAAIPEAAVGSISPRDAIADSLDVDSLAATGAPLIAGLAGAYPPNDLTAAFPEAPPSSDAAEAPRKAGRSRRIRHSMAMPFFSFAPRG